MGHRFGVAGARHGASKKSILCVGRLLAQIAVVVTAVAVSSAAWAQSFTFNSVDVRGNQRVDTATILSYTNIQRGQTVSAAELNQAVQNIQNSGLFEEVEIIPRGNTLVIEVQEFPTINRINFEGNRRIGDEELQGIIQSRPRRVFSPAQAEADAAIITEALRQQGRISASVEPRIIRRSENRVDLVFEVVEGAVTEIERISFVGNRTYSDRRLRRVLESKQAGLFRAFINADTLIEDRIEFDRQLLTDFYQSRGFVDFEVLSATPELDRNRAAFLLTINVREGQQFRVGTVSVSSEIATIDPDLYLEGVRIREGVVYSPVLVDRDIVRLERQAVKDGEDFVRVEPRITRNDRDLELDIEYVISRGPRVFVERIDIEGNTSTLDRVVRRQFDFVEGDPFNPREVRDSAERIRSMGFFEDAQVQTREGTAPEQVIVDVDVVEAPTGSLGFGANYSTNSGFGFAVNFSERNFLGRGQSVAADLSLTETTGNFGFSFNEPAFLGRDLGFGFSGFWRETTRDNSRFNTRRGFLGPTLRFPLTETSSLSLRLPISYTEVFGIDRGFPDDSNDESDTGSSNVLREEEDLGGLYSYSFGYTYSYDSRLTGLDPTSGVLFRFRQDFGFRTDDSSFIRTEVLTQARKAILNEEVVLRAEFEAGAIVFSGGPSRITERFSLSNKIRGFEPNGVGPRDLNVTNEDVLNGNMFAVARFEADFPLGLPEEYGITGGVFYDIGSVWGLDNANGGPDGNDPIDDDFILRSAAGVSVFWDSVLGPLRFNFSRPITKESYDEEQNFEFTISTRF